MSANLLWKLSISENIALYNCALKHPKTIHLRIMTSQIEWDYGSCALEKLHINKTLT